MKALTLWQPWASLMAEKVKTIETRSWAAPASAIGERVLITAAARKPEVDGQQGLLQTGDWWVEDTRLGSFTMHRDLEINDVALPLGVAVASGVLTACVPIVDVMAGGGPADHDDHRQAVYVCGEGLPLELVDRFTYQDDPAHTTIIEEQRPYGDFRPGRWAWLFDDLAPVTERCPACWGRCIVNIRSTSEMSTAALESGALIEGDRCPLCNCDGVVAAFPVRGRQRLWNWEPGSSFSSQDTKAGTND